MAYGKRKDERFEKFFRKNAILGLKKKKADVN